jgi:hypothetical protein
MPDLSSFVDSIVRRVRATAPRATPLVDLIGHLGTSASDFLTACLRRFAETQGFSLVDFTSHCCRIGTCTALLELGVAPHLANQHCGWATASDSWATYNRPGTAVTKADVLFYFAALN